MHARVLLSTATPSQHRGPPLLNPACASRWLFCHLALAEDSKQVVTSSLDKSLALWQQVSCLCGDPAFE